MNAARSRDRWKEGTQTLQANEHITRGMGEDVSHGPHALGTCERDIAEGHERRIVKAEKEAKAEKIAIGSETGKRSLLGLQSGQGTVIGGFNVSTVTYDRWPCRNTKISLGNMSS